MLLSYWLRLVCLVLFSMGVIQVTLHLLIWLVMPLAERRVDQMSARFQERIYFVAPVASHVLALLLSLLVVAPQYIRDETNPLQERVGVVCVTGALLVAVRYLYGLLRAIQLLLQMHAHKHDDEPVVLMGDMAVHISAEGYPLLAVAGLFSPRVVLSQHLLDNAAFSPQLLEIALAHEKAHVRHHDNLKHFVLASLALSCPGIEGSLQCWRYAAEHAADDDAVSGSSSRAILLAETLLVAARTVPPQRTPAFSLGLLPHEEELDQRIGRLLRDDSVLAATVTPSWRPTMYTAALFLASACALLHLFAASLHEVAEYVLHLG
jgi:beta-lactamase regulating signal transducer with metallopeptidase domain